MKICLVMCLVIFTGCAQLTRITDLVKPEESQQELDPEVAAKQKAAEEPEVINAEKVLALGRFEEARILFRDFQARSPRSVFFESARLGEAQCLEGLGRPQDAVNLYRDVFLKTERYRPEIAALALYRMSFGYEALGDDLKMVASLLDARKRGASLPVEITQAQIPARLAAAYARQNREAEAMAYLNEAEKGIARVIVAKGKDLKVDWLAKIYVEMGSVSTNQLSVENFEDFVRSQKTVQVYLLKALKQNDPVWSARGLARLQETYQALFTQLDTAKKDQEMQSIVGGSFVELMDQADLFKPMGDQKMSPFERDFFDFLGEIRKKTGQILYGGTEGMTLTEESQKLNSLRRSGTIRVESYLPAERKSFIPLPPKVVPAEDPNL